MLYTIFNKKKLSFKVLKNSLVFPKTQLSVLQNYLNTRKKMSFTTLTKEFFFLAKQYNCFLG